MIGLHVHGSSARKPGFMAGELKSYKGCMLFVKKVDSKKHKLRIFDGYGIQESVLKGLIGYVVIIESDTGKYLVSEIKDWKEHGITRTLNPRDGMQRFLSTDSKFMQTFSDRVSALQYIDTLIGIDVGIVN